MADLSKNIGEKILKRFDDIDGKLDALETKFVSLETQFTSLGSRFSGLELDFHGLDSRFNMFELRFDLFSSKVDKLEKRMSSVADYLMRHEITLKTLVRQDDFDAFRDKNLSQHDAFAKSLDCLTTEFTSFQGANTRLEERMDFAEADICLLKAA
jgi:hypothetical protein